MMFADPLVPTDITGINNHLLKNPSTAGSTSSVSTASSTHRMDAENILRPMETKDKKQSDQLDELLYRANGGNYPIVHGVPIDVPIGTVLTGLPPHAKRPATGGSQFPFTGIAGEGNSTPVVSEGVDVTPSSEGGQQQPFTGVAESGNLNPKITHGTYMKPPTKVTL
ncbi:UNVERIFIED_CONTAM: hypothetical protein HDU68_007793 [Siphonaria sp. JEL0065]|nr:hypothetical protein HDU68_007793 [Siphonaria sp. JEL0065]